MNARVKAFLIFVLFIVVAQLLSGGLGWLLINKLQVVSTTGAWRPSFFFYWEVPRIIGALTGTYLVARLSRKKFSELGYNTAHVGRQFGWGALVGFAAITIATLIALVFGGYDFGEPTMGFFATMGYAIAWFLAMLGTAIAAEMVFRGTGLLTLADAAGFWPAAIILSLLLAVLSLGRPGQDLNVAAAINGFVMSMLACYTVRRTGAIWFAIGFHALLDFSALFIYGSSTGSNAGGNPIESRLHFGGYHGADWITGGSSGIESSWLLLPVLLALSMVVFYRMREPQ